MPSCQRREGDGEQDVVAPFRYHAVEASPPEEDGFPLSPNSCLSDAVMCRDDTSHYLRLQSTNQEIPRTPGGTPSISSRESRPGAPEARGPSKEANNDGKLRQGALTAELSTLDEGTQGGAGSRAGAGLGGPTESMIQLALRRKFANTRKSLLPDRR